LTFARLRLVSIQHVALPVEMIMGCAGQMGIVP
jgi:hypothetical protein